jgi:Tfp pilus assembly protein PilO
MNLKKLPKEKQQQLFLIALVTVGVLAGIFFGLIKAQYEGLSALAQKKANLKGKVAQVTNTVAHADQLETELTGLKKALAVAESDTALGDRYSWVITTVRKFKAGYNVDIPQFSPISAEGDCTLLPNFPYKQATLTVVGAGRFQEFGRFLADFENTFPHIRVVNLTLDPNPNPAPEQQETIQFRMDLVTLVRPGSS